MQQDREKRCRARGRCDAAEVGEPELCDGASEGPGAAGGTLLCPLGAGEALGRAGEEAHLLLLLIPVWN